MLENANTPGNAPTSLGKVQRVDVQTFEEAAQVVGSNQNTNEAVVQTLDAPLIAGVVNAETVISPISTEQPVFTEEQKKAFFKTLGVEYTGESDIETIKNRLKPDAVIPTEEDKIRQQNAHEMKLLAKFTENGKNTTEQFNLIKTLANLPASEFSRKAAIDALVEAGVSKEEAEPMAKEMYYQIELNNLEPELEETDEEFAARKAKLEKKIALGAKLLESQNSHKQTAFKNILQSLNEAVEADELLAKQEVSILSKVDETLSKFARKKTFELGKVNDTDIPPIQYEVSDATITQVRDILKDPVKRNNFLFNQDGTLNIDNLTEVMVSNFELKGAVKAALLEGQSRQVALIQSVFPYDTPFSLGVGGSAKNANGNGQAVKIGKIQRMNPINS